MSYLEFELLDPPLVSKKKTKVWCVNSVRSGSTLGTVKWYSNWRQYTFWPDSHTIWNKDCLREIAEFCEQQTRDHYEKLKAKGHTDTHARAPS